MPDQSDVEAALAGFLAGTLYPNGAALVSVVGPVCRVFPGWPVAAALEADLALGVVQISVVAMPGHVRDTTRYPLEMVVVLAPVATLSVSISGETVAFCGVAALGQVAGVLVDGRAYAYRVQAGDDAGSVASALAALVRVDRPVALTGSSVGFVGARGLVGRVVMDGAGGAELRRQVMAFRVSVWAPMVGIRDQVASVLDGALAGVTFLDVGGWGCRVRAGIGAVSDQGAVAGVWRRDLGVSVEFPTAVVEALPAMLFGVDGVNGVSVSA